MVDFELRNIGAPPDEIIPDIASEIDIETARTECEKTVQNLTADLSGIGQKAAERYLLRYEYGFGPTELAQKFDVTPSTITNQTSAVREKILRYPKLAQSIGQFRTERARLTEPVITENPLWDDQLSINGTEIDAQIGFYSGTYGDPYSWQYSLQAETQVEDEIRHLIADYVVDAECGVLLKRTFRGISYKSWQETPLYQPKRRYTVYPLPNRRIPNEDGTLMDAVEYHAVYDMTTTFLGDYVEQEWTALEMDAKSSDDIKRPSARFSLPEVLLDRIRHENPLDAVSEYSREVRIRDNIEHILRLYPLEDILQIPFNTVELLWAGSLKFPEVEESGTEALRHALKSSQITTKPGDRAI